MLVEVRNNSTFFSHMQRDPSKISEKLFQGIDRDYNVSHICSLFAIFNSFAIKISDVTHGGFEAYFAVLNPNFLYFNIT